MMSPNSDIHRKRQLMQESFKKMNHRCLDELEPTNYQNNESMCHNGFLSPDSPIISGYNEPVPAAMNQPKSRNVDIHQKRLLMQESFRKAKNNSLDDLDSSAQNYDEFLSMDSPAITSHGNAIPARVNQQEPKKNSPSKGQKHFENKLPVPTTSAANANEDVFKVPAVRMAKRKCSPRKSKQKQHYVTGNILQLNGLQVLMISPDEYEPGPDLVVIH